MHAGMAPPPDSSRRRRVAIVYRIVPRYRLAFYELLRERLDARGIELALIYGQPGPEDAKKADTVDVPWGRYLPSRIVRLGGREIYWQPVLGAVAACDLVVVEQASKLLVNYPLMARQALGGPKVAFWGHGRNFQSGEASALGEWIKRQLSTRVHWWFAYNEASARIVADLGFPRERITDVRNAIDTRSLAAAADAVDEDQRARLRASLGLGGGPVGLFIGGMYPGKGLPFLLEACRRIRARVPGFEALFVGAGSEQAHVERATEHEAWIHYLGPRHGDDKARVASLADVMLMPRYLGLVVLDAFALGLPLITTDAPGHGPELAYLEHGVNGLVVASGDDPGPYADAVSELLLDPPRLERMRERCLRDREAYSIEEMARRFADGIEAALDAIPRGPAARRRASALTRF